MNIQEHIVQMAQAHARIEAIAYKQRGSHESQGILNSNMTQIVDLVIESLPDNPPELYELYLRTFWQTYSLEELQGGQGQP